VDDSVLENLLARNLLLKTEHEGQKFFVRRFPKRFAQR